MTSEKNLQGTGRKEMNKKHKQKQFSQRQRDKTSNGREQGEARDEDQTRQTHRGRTPTDTQDRKTRPSLDAYLNCKGRHQRQASSVSLIIGNTLLHEKLPHTSGIATGSELKICGITRETATHIGHCKPEQNYMCHIARIGKALRHIARIGKSL